MSNSVGRSLLGLAVWEHQSKVNSFNCVAGNTLFQAQANSQIRKFSSSLSSSSPSLLSSDFRGHRLTVRKSTLPKIRVVSGFAQDVLATDPASELGGKFILGGDVEMQVDVKISSALLIEIQLTNSTDHLYLHWGGTRNTNEKWVLPSHHPEGTKVYNDQALRTPFVKSGSNSFLKVEIDDPAIQAIEFLIVDETQNKWYKNNGQNFRVKLPLGKKQVSKVVVPEHLLQIQAYLRWERKGKQMYTPEQEKASYLCHRTLQIF